MMEPRGYDRPALNRCLADTAMADRIARQTVDGDKAGVAGTPSFMLNGVLLTGTYDWKSLHAQIDARL
jgi:protein-disulfide isomerase